MPKITIAMPIYNDETYVREAVDSILAQTLNDFELLIVDDGSTDGTPDIINAYTDKRIRIISFEHNKGRPFARNAALDAARGKYLAWMDADDISLPQRLQRQVDFLDDHPQVTVCGCAIQCFHERNDAVRFPMDDDDILAGIVWGPTIPNPGSCIRLASIRKHGLHYDENMLRAEDYAFWSDVLLKSGLRAANLPEILVHWRYFHRPSSPLYHARAAQRVLSYLGLPNDEASTLLHTLLSCGAGDGIILHNAPEVLNWANAVYEAVTKQERIPPQSFITTACVKVEKYLCTVNPLLPALGYYRQLPLAIEHPLWRLLSMLAIRKVVGLLKK